MVTQALELTGWIFVFAAITGGVIAGIARFTSRDSTQYDMEFLWEHRHTLEELELKKP